MNFIPFLFFFILFFAGFSSCSLLEGKLLVMEGNFYQASGLSNKAIVSYLKAAAYPDARAYASFGLGAVYYSLNEADSALGRFAESENLINAAPKPEYKGLMSRIYYNAGVIFFEKEQYHEASVSFRRALEADSGFVEAKRNLELSLLARERKENSAWKTPESAAEEKEKVRNKALFDYLRDKESRQWKSQEWVEEPSGAGADY